MNIVPPSHPSPLPPCPASRALGDARDPLALLPALGPQVQALSETVDPGFAELEPIALGDREAERLPACLVVIVEGDLHQRELRPEGALADEFGIQADPQGPALQVRIQRGGGVYPVGQRGLRVIRRLLSQGTIT